jgi:hypothetical protein
MYLRLHKVFTMIHRIEAEEFVMFCGDQGLIELNGALERKIHETYNNIMSKRRQKPVVTTVSAEEQERLIKSVFELYKPNKVGLFLMKYFKRFTNVDQIASILKMSKDKVIELEKKYYLNK